MILGRESPVTEILGAANLRPRTACRGQSLAALRMAGQGACAPYMGESPSDRSPLQSKRQEFDGFHTDSIQTKLQAFL